MASPQASTLASREATPELLTPRSKIKALLATVDSSDDEGEGPKSIIKKALQNRSKSPEDESDGESDSDVQIRPRGKLAARLQAGAMAAVVAEPPPPSSDPVETARDRVKKLMVSEERIQDQEGDTEMVDGNGQDEDEDDELPTKPHKLKRRPARAESADLEDPPARADSPALFVSSPMRPSPSKNIANVDSGSEDDMPAVKSDRFKALVERKRQERLAREAAEEAKNAERRARQEQLALELEEMDSDKDDDGITDDEGGIKLTQQDRPARKASKKAIEEMNRETQRMQRSMQLAHEAKTRKKVTKASLFERFNFRPAGQQALPSDSAPTTSSRPPSPQSSAGLKDKETPPSSPPAAANKDTTDAEIGVDAVMGDLDNDLPSITEVIDSAPPKLDKGKGKAVAIDLGEEISQSMEKTKKRVRVRLPLPSANLAMVDSDDELEVTTTTKDKINAVFDSMPFKKAQESTPLQALRALAHVGSPEKETRRKGDQHGMSPGELLVYLQQKAREQAKVERGKRLDMLKAQGVVIQTAEERERQMQEVEDILAKAREEGQRIMQEERAAAKKEGGEDGEADPLAWDESEDEEYEDGGNDADAEGSAVELSGSEEEEDEDEDEDGANPMFEAEAEEGGSETSDAEQAASDGDEALPVLNRKKGRNKNAVLSDDESDDIDAAIKATPKSKTTVKMSPSALMSDSPAAPGSVLRSAKKNFIPGLPVNGAAGLGLTQIFAGTMDASQTSEAGGPTQSMMPDFDAFPDSNFSATADDVEDMVLDSQLQATQNPTQGVQFDLAQTQMRGMDSLLRENFNSQVSDMVDPSQDVGFQTQTPLKNRFDDPPASTVETVPADQRGEELHDSPLVRRGRLRRKMEMTSIDEEDSIVPSTMQEASPAPDESAFAAMKDGAEKERKKKLADDFNKKKSKAKEMVEEQAEESEDEYAGLGGADGEDSDNESTASIRDIIDDAAGNEVDERKLAAFFADRERAKDEKEIEKLYKDITNGMLRRKRGADYDLSDSDDDGEARRRMKRRQFAKMQKALFADERVKKIAEDPGNQAFLRTLEDKGSDDEMDFLNIVETSASQREESQSQDESGSRGQSVVPDSQPGNSSTAATRQARAPAVERRTKNGKKPSNIGEVRETLSDLLDERHSSVIPATELGSDSEDENRPVSSRSNRESTSPNARRTRTAVVDRISLKRNASSTSTTTNRLAFASGGASSSSFKVPALLRRATTNSSLISGTNTSSSMVSSAKTGSTAGASSGSGFGDEAKIKKQAGKMSGVNGFNRDSDRKARLAESERRRQEKKVRGAESRAGLVGGLLGKGSFE